MTDQIIEQPAISPQNSVSFLPLGGIEDVTRNMYVYEYNDEILLVDCGIGFPDETMLGVDLLLPDITYLLKTNKKIVGMVLTHGHEDHIGALPFILPQLPDFPIFASPLTAALSNQKLIEFQVGKKVESVPFDDRKITLGAFSVSFIRVTHSVPDSANIFIRTPAGNFFHGSDYKFDFSPDDGNRTDFHKIMKAQEEGILGLMSDCLGSERGGFTPSEEPLSVNFEREMRECKGNFIITTYSSNIARLNQAIRAAEHLGKKVCFVGRSLIKAKEIGLQLGYLHIGKGVEIAIPEVKKHKGQGLLLLVAGSQGQETSSMTRIAEGEHSEIRLDASDTVVFSSDIIPGNEINVNQLIDSITKIGAKVIYSSLSNLFHVSGHGSVGDHMLLVALTKPRYLVPISGTFRQMTFYRTMGEKMGFQRNDIFLVENGQEVQFVNKKARLGKKIEIKNVFVDQFSGEEVEHYVVRDRERLAKEGVVIVIAEIKKADGQLIGRPDIVSRGTVMGDTNGLSAILMKELERFFSSNQGKVSNLLHVRRLMGKRIEQYLYKNFHTQPLVLPVIIEM